jgi:hypothetical protein
LDALKSVEYGESKIKGKVALLQNIEIFKNYSGKGLFNPFFQLILGLLKKVNVEFIILQAYPVGIPLNNIEQINKEKSRLQTFYMKYGFIFYICAYVSQEPYMFLFLNS